MIWSLIALFIILPVTSQAQETCSINLVINQEGFSPQGSHVRGDLSITFSRQGDHVVPVVELSVSSNFEFEKVAIRWSDTDLINSLGRPLFPSPFQEIVKAESESRYPLLNAAQEGVYRSPFWGFSRLQVFLALFYSQNDFELEFIDDRGQVVRWQRVPLQNTDLQFRTLAGRCFPEKSQDYLSGLQRLKPVTEAWQNAYGVIDFQSIKQLSPKLYRKAFTGEREIEKSKNSLQELQLYLGRLQKLQDDARAFNEREGTQAFFSDLQAVTESLVRVEREFTQINAEGGALASLDKRRSQLNFQMFGFKETIKGLKGELKKRTRRHAGPRHRLDRSLEELHRLEEDALAARSTLVGLKVALDDLKTLAASAPVQDYVQMADPTSAGPSPLGYVEIFGTVDELVANRSQRDSLRGYQQLLQFVDNEIKIMDQLTSRLLVKLNELQTVRAQIAELQLKIDAKVEVNFFLEEQFYGLSYDAITEKLAEEEDHSTFEQKPLIAGIRSSYKEYDELLATAATDSLSPEIVKKVICSSDSFQRDSSGSCLTPIQIANEQNVSRYFSGLSAGEIQSFRSLFGREQVDFNGAPFDEDIALEWTILQSSIPMAALQEAWEKVLYSRWKYFTGRELKFKDVDKASLIEANNALQAQRQENLTIIETLHGEIAEMTPRYELSQAVFQAHEDEYRRIVHKIKGKIRTFIELDSASIPDTENIDCLYFQEVLLLCKPLISEQRSYVDDQVSALNSELGRMVALLSQSIPPTLRELQRDTTQAATNLARLEERIADFKRQEGLAGRIRHVEQLKQARDRKGQELDGVEGELLKAQMLARRADTKKRVLAKRNFRLTVLFHELRQEILPVEAQRTRMCEFINRLLTDYEDTQTSVLKSLQVNLEPPLWVQEGRVRCFQLADSLAAE